MLLYRVPGERTTPSEDATNGGAADIEDEQAFAAAPTTNYKIWVTLTDVPVGADDLLVNATVNRGLAVDEKLVTNPSEGDVVKFDFKVPKGGSGNSAIICGTQANSPEINSCDLFPLPTKSGDALTIDPTKRLEKENQDLKVTQAQHIARLEARVNETERLLQCCQRQ